MLDNLKKLHTPEEIYAWNLGAALSMENTVLDMLGDLQEETQREELRHLFSHHADETKQQIRNIQEAFRLLGQEPDTNPCPAMEAIEKEGKTNIKKTDKDVVDATILAGALETEHHEMAVYESLVVNAEARGAQEVARLMRENLEMEQHTAGEVQREMTRLAHQGFAKTA